MHLILHARAALADIGPPPTPEDLWTRFTLDPLVTLPLGVLTAAWLLGLWRQGFPPRRTRLALAALGALALALLTPLDALGKALLSAHMVQHLVLVLVAAPLLVLARPEAALPHALPRGARRRLARGWRRSPRFQAAWRGLLSAPSAFTLHLLAIWIWHAPPLYQAALEHDALHALEHASFVLTGVLMWRVVLHPRARAAIGHGGALLVLFGTALHSGVLGVLIGFTPLLWYPIYARSTAAFGLSPMEDQQLAGAIMWVPGGAVYAAVAVGVLRGWLRASERRRARLDRALGGEA